MNLSVDSFQKVASRLGDNDEIHQRNEQKLVETRWQRFKTGFCNFFRSFTQSGREAIANENKAIRQSFLASLRQKYGDTLGNYAEKNIAGGKDCGRPLTARVVRDTLSMVEAQGGKNWLANQKLAQEMSMNCYPRSVAPTVPNSLSHVVQQAFSKTMDLAGNLPGEVADKMRFRYSPPYSAGCFRPGELGAQMADVQKGIQNALTYLGRVETYDNPNSYLPTISFRKISLEEAVETATERASFIMTGELKKLLVNHMVDGDPPPLSGRHYFDEHLDAVLAEKGLTGFRPYLKIDQLKEDARQAVAGSGMPIDMKKAEMALHACIEKFVSKMAGVPENARKAAESFLANHPESTCSRELLEKALTEKTMALQSRNNTEACLLGVANMHMESQKLIDRLLSAGTKEEVFSALVEFGTARDSIIRGMGRDLSEWGAEDSASFNEQFLDVHFALLSPDDKLKIATALKKEEVSQSLGTLRKITEENNESFLGGSVLRLASTQNFCMQFLAGSLDRCGESETTINDLIQNCPRPATLAEIPQEMVEKTRELVAS